MFRLVLYGLLLCLAGNTLVSAQVYNYLPLIYSDAETNPTVLVSDKIALTPGIKHQNSFSSAHPFSISQISVAKNFDRLFCGAGLTVTNTNFRNHTYNHAAFSFAYRNVLMNSIFFRLGASYKLIQNNAGPGAYDYFSFTPVENSQSKQFNGNVNFSAALASSHERYHLSFSVLNLFPSKPSDTLTLFPKYYLLHAGNLLSFFKRGISNSEISFTFLRKSGNETISEYWSGFVNLYYDMKINRRKGLLIGGRSGVSNTNFQFIPTVCLYTSRFYGALQYSFFMQRIEETIIPIPTFQMNLNFKL